MVALTSATPALLLTTQPPHIPPLLFPTPLILLLTLLLLMLRPAKSKLELSSMKIPITSKPRATNNKNPLKKLSRDLRKKLLKFLLLKPPTLLLTTYPQPLLNPLKAVNTKQPPTQPTPPSNTISLLTTFNYLNKLKLTTAPLMFPTKELNKLHTQPPSLLLQFLPNKSLNTKPLLTSAS